MAFIPLLLVVGGLVAQAQDTLFVQALVPYNHPIAISVAKYHGPAPLRFDAPIYSFQQGKLPLFCAFEDRVWRRTGLPMQFRLTDRRMGSW